MLVSATPIAARHARVPNSTSLRDVARRMLRAIVGRRWFLRLRAFGISQWCRGGRLPECGLRTNAFYRLRRDVSDFSLYVPNAFAASSLSPEEFDGEGVGDGVVGQHEGE